MSKIVSAEEAIREVEDGCSVAIGGMSFHRAPMGLVREIIRQNKRDLEIIAREPGLSFDMLIGAGCVKKVKAAYVGFENLGLAPNFRRMVERGDIKMEDHACYSIMQGLRATVMGLPFLPSKGFFGTDMMSIHEEIGDFARIRCPFTGEELVAIEAIKPDFAIIHAQRSDEHGNVQIDGQIFEDDLMAFASKKTIVSVEEIIDEEDIMRAPERTTVPYFEVDYIVNAPKGAHPCSCFNYYDPDIAQIKEYLEGEK